MSFVRRLESNRQIRRDGSRLARRGDAASVPWIRRETLFAAGIGLLASLAPGLSAIAATADSTVTISATVQATCTQTVTPLAFGTYTGVVLPGTATITVTCTNTTPYDIGLDSGLSTGATVTTRAMTAAGATLNYVLTSDAAHAINWGNTVGVDSIHVVATLTPIVTTIYGQVAVGQFVAPGAYTDTIAATVTY
jgi:spore coat protein U-like protein